MKDHKCFVSTGICGSPTFGTGELDHNGYWEKPCAECAREHEAKYPNDGPCWPFKSKQNVFERNTQLNANLKAAVGAIAGALDSFEKHACTCPERTTEKHCLRGNEMPEAVYETFHCTPCLWAWCPRVPDKERQEFLNSPAHENK